MAHRALLVGAGGMGHAWLNTMRNEPRVELAGVVDIDPDRAGTAAQEYGDGSASGFTDVSEGIRATTPDLLIDVADPDSHHPVTTTALRAGVPVIGEKPATSTLPQAVELAALSRLTGVPFVVSQNRRYEPNAGNAVAAIAAIGQPELVTATFALGAHFGGFRATMESPLLYDMSIHHLDYLRYLMGALDRRQAEVADVYCEEFSPSWNWFAGNASCAITLRFVSGAFATYTGSWCSVGLNTSWNADWRVSAPHGTVLWDGVSEPRVEVIDDFAGVAAPPVVTATGLAASLAGFLDHLDGGPLPATAIADNLQSLALVFAAMESSRSGARVSVPGLIDRARSDAAAAMTDSELARAINDLDLAATG
jgi:predicted dehydrogenase